MARARGSRRTPEEARENYEIKLAVMPESYKVKTGRMKEHATRIEDMMQALNVVYSILDERGITRKDRIDYLNYARKLIRLKARYTSNALRRAVAEERPKWESIGLDRDIMRAIETAIIGETAGGGGGAITVR